MKSLVWLVIGIAVLGGLFLYFKQKSGFTNPVASVTVATPAPTPTPQKQVLEVAVKDGKIVADNNTITLKQGDTVTLKITSDTTGTFHIHGYDREIEVTKDVTKEEEFTADKTGKFEVELHTGKTEKEIGSFEVYPQQ